MFIVFDLSPEAIASLDKLAEESGLTRSEFIEKALVLFDAANATLPVRPVFHERADRRLIAEDLRRTMARYQLNSQSPTPDE